MIKHLMPFFNSLIRGSSTATASDRSSQSGETTSSRCLQTAAFNRPRTQIEWVSWDTHQASLQSIRTAVFVDEQQIDPADEWDDQDAQAVHLLAIRDDQPVGCARILDGHKIGRMAVLAQHRQHNVGSKLLRAAITRIQDGGHEPTLGAQVSAMGFYANHGFLPEGPVFNDAGIPHRQMRLAGDQSKTLMPLDADSLRFDTPTLLVAIEPQIDQGCMRINLLRLSADEAAWLTPRLCCVAATHGMHTLILEIPEGETHFPLQPSESF